MVLKSVGARCVRRTSPSRRPSDKEYMSIRKKVLGTICCITFCLILIFYAVTSLVIDKDFSRLERRVVIENLERVQATLKDRIQALDTLAHDWASRDDTCIFIQNRNEDFITSNIVEDTFATSANIDLLLIYNMDAQLIQGVLFNRQTGQMESPDAELLSALTEEHRLLSRSFQETGRCGIVQVGSRSFLIAARPILDSNGQGPVRGTLIMGRILNSERVAYLQKVTRAVIELYPLQQANIPPAAMDASEALFLSHILHEITVFSEKIIKGYSLLYDISGNAVLLLGVDVKRDIHKQSRHTLLFLLYSIIAIGVIFGLVTFFLIDTPVLGRLTKLTDDIVEIEKDATRGLRVKESTSGDELGKLSRSINRMMDAIESLEEYKIKSEKLEALATFAAGATHELATPLSTIAIASGEILYDLKEENTTEEELYEDILLIREQVNRCKDILYQMAADAGEHMGEKFVSLTTGKLVEETLALFSEKTWEFLGLNSTQLIMAGALSGAAVGAGADLIAGGLSVGAFAVVGGLVGAVGTAIKGKEFLSGTRLLGMRLDKQFLHVGPVKNIQLLFVLLDRQLLFYKHIINWAHGRRDYDLQVSGQDDSPVKSGYTSGWNREDRMICESFFRTLQKTDQDDEKSSYAAFSDLLQRTLRRISLES